MAPATTKTKTNGDGRHLNFEIAVSGDNTPLELTIGKEKFKCLPDIPGIYLAEFIAATEKDFGIRMEVALNFIRGALAQEEEQRFEQFLRSKTSIVPVRTLAEVAAGLVEAYAARPTEPPSD